MTKGPLPSDLCRAAEPGCILAPACPASCAAWQTNLSGHRFLIGDLLHFVAELHVSQFKGKLMSKIEWSYHRNG